ncbi:hypothetical protein [uncultured Thiodictyon sp.]|uniref:hypothetical protein n=1 Tax=uncultured Thiodictyon sp. TaxID=1846217 RepID=UPI0025D6424C|nr:hypothetical protein [uncultured Thiodictyon sp.]
MHQTKSLSVPIIGLLTLALPGAAFASYDGNDAIRDCESRIRSEYKLTDLRDATVQRLNDGALHFKVQGQTKVDGDRHPWTCEVKDRHVTAAEYSGPKPKGLSTAEKIAIGTATVAAGAIAINAAGKHSGTSQTGSGAGGAKDLQDLVGARAAGGESELQSRGYTYASGSKGGRQRLYELEEGLALRHGAHHERALQIHRRRNYARLRRRWAIGRKPIGTRGLGGRGAQGPGRRQGRRRRDRAAKPRL